MSSPDPWWKDLVELAGAILLFAAFLIICPILGWLVNEGILWYLAWRR